MSQSSDSTPTDHIVVQTLWLLGCLVAYIVIAGLNDGKFTYTLDDPYIHLAVAEQVASGHYGVNGNEVSSPSSSAIWPLLLAPFAKLAIGEFAPLLLNVCFGSLTGFVLIRRLRKLIPDSDNSSPRLHLTRAAFALAVLVAGNTLGLALTGMEHSLQLLAAVVAVDAILTIASQPANDERMQWWHWASLIGAPLIRYESMTLTVAACVLLVLSKRWKPALVIGFGSLLLLGCFSAFLMSLGLAPLPNSVQAKLAMGSTDGGLVQNLWLRLVKALTSDRGAVLAAMTLVPLGVAAISQSFGSRAKVGISLAIAGGLHLVAGNFGWYNRYEAYLTGALAFGVIVLLLAGRDSSARPPGLLAGCFAILASCACSFSYLTGLSTTPTAANNIYEQQYQMHRFVVESWKRPVAVNDLGWVSYRNDNYVLDLWGLASHEALAARLAGGDPSWSTKITAKKKVDLAIIYQEIFPELREKWVKVAEMRLSKPRITPSYPRVSFYAANEQVAQEAESLLLEFRRSLPEGVTLVTRSEHESSSATEAP